MSSSPLSVIKKPNLSHYACRSRNAMFFGLESGLGAFTRTAAGYCWSRTQGDLVLQRCLWCVCFVMVSLGSLCRVGGQDRYLFGRRQQCWTQALSGTFGSFLSLFFTLSICFGLRRSIICLLLQPTSIAKTPVPEILFPHHRFRSLTSLATPKIFTRFLYVIYQFATLSIQNRITIWNKIIWFLVIQISLSFMKWYQRSVNISTVRGYNFSNWTRLNRCIWRKECGPCSSSQFQSACSCSLP